MARTRSASGGDEVVTPSSRRSSLTSADNTQLRRSTRNKGKTAPKRSHDDEKDDELEASLPPKKLRYPKRDIVDARSSKKPTARRLFTHNNTSTDHLNNSIPSTPHKGSLAPFSSLPGSPQMANTGKNTANADLVKWMAQWKTADDNKPKTIFDIGHILQDVLVLVPEDKDVVNFARTAKRSYHGSFTIGLINNRFTQIFEEFAVERKNHEDDEMYYERRLKELKVFYTTAQGLSHRQVLFSSWGRDAVKDQDLCVSVLKVLMTNSDASLDRNAKGFQEVNGKNHDWIISYLSERVAIGHTRGTDILDYVSTGRTFPQNTKARRKAATRLEVVLKICLIHVALNPETPQFMSRFLDSQQAAFACRSRVRLFQGRYGHFVNPYWLEHNQNYWKFHLRQGNGEGLLTHLFENLSKENLPRPWPGKLENGTKKLGPKWKGAFAYLEDDDVLMALRNGTIDNPVEDETSEDNEGFQDLNIFNEISDFGNLKFPEVYEDQLKAKPKGKFVDPNTGQKTTPAYKDFFGLGRAKVKYHLYGRMHALPPQAGIPGWQRVSMMKEMPNWESSKYGAGQTETWAYEGIVLPGGQIIIGRWFDPIKDSYSGPFIFWQVSSDVDTNDSKDALEFMKQVEKDTV